MGLDDIQGVICLSPVDDEVFLLLPGLALHAADGPFQFLGVVAAHSDNRDNHVAKIQKKWE